MDDRALRGWVDDRLFALLGLSEASLASFVVALGASPAPCSPVASASLTPPAAKKASSPAQLAAQLAEQASPQLRQPPDATLLRPTLTLHAPQGLPAGEATRSFAADLLSRVPRKAADTVRR